MEDKTKITNPNPSTTDNSEKTVVMSSNQNQARQKPADQEKSQINEPKEEPKIESKSEAQHDSAKSAKDFIADAKDKKSISPGMAAGGAALSGVAGVALGAGFSEQIKAAFASPISEEEANSTDDIPAVEETDASEESAIAADETNTTIGVPVSDETPVEEVSSSSVEELPPLPELEPDNSHRMEFSVTDAEGNVISVSFLDIDGDGQIENQTMEFQLVDGTSIYYSESGNSLEPLFSQNFQLAGANDYIDCGFCGVQDVNMMDSFLYQIQPGDTLSEIAAANNTSIAHLMELNPQISNPNMILAGHNLIVPEGDNSNPYEGWDQGYESPLVADGSYFVDEIEEASTGYFETIDWQSYYDSPVENPYTSELAQMDFETLETPQSYYETEYDMGDYGMGESGFGFI